MYGIQAKKDIVMLMEIHNLAAGRLKQKLVGKMDGRYLELIYQHRDGKEGVVLCLILHVTRSVSGAQARRNKDFDFRMGRILPYRRCRRFRIWVE